MRSSWTAARTSITWKSGCRITSEGLGPHVCGCAAALPPEGAQVSLGRPGGDLMFELSLLCPEQKVETLSEALDALDALSVSVEDADAQTEGEQALFGEPGMPPPKEGWQRSRMVALFPSEDAARDAADLLAAQDFFGGCQVLGI